MSDQEQEELSRAGTGVPRREEASDRGALHPPTDPLRQFVLERIAEDEEVAHRAGGGRWVPAVRREETASWTEVSQWLVTRPSGGPVQGPEVAALGRPGDQQHVVRWDPARVLTDCAVRRRLVELGAGPVARTVLVELAATWATHPDHRSPWPPPG